MQKVEVNMQRYLLAGLATVILASSANAAVTITSVSITGVTSTGAPSGLGTIWDTANDGHYGVFVSPNDGAALNPNKFPFDGASAPVTLGDNGFSIKGQTYAVEPFYKITLVLSDGITLSAIYDRLNSVDEASTSAVAAGVGYTITGFDWNRGTSNLVSEFNNRPDKNGTRSDFEGTFTLTAVPEPASWGMMLVGFGMVGFAARRRAKSAVKVTFA